MTEYKSNVNAYGNENPKGYLSEYDIIGYEIFRRGEKLATINPNALLTEIEALEATLSKVEVEDEVEVQNNIDTAVEESYNSGYEEGGDEYKVHMAPLIEELAEVVAEVADSKALQEIVNRMGDLNR